MSSSLSDRCPCCGTSISIRFPDSWPTLEELSTSYAETVHAASANNNTMSAKVLGIAYNTFLRLLTKARQTKRKAFPMSDEEKAAAIKWLKNRKPLELLGDAGMDGGIKGDYVEIAASTGSIFYDIRYNDVVVKYDVATFLNPGEKPFVCFFGDDNILRRFSFGDPVKKECVCTFAGGGPRQLTCSVIPRDVYAAAESYFASVGRRSTVIGPDAKRDDVPAVL